ncbi:PREDICTED: uncharacterized protein LOC105579248 isoform X2 [Cercocebus atys]|uniref:uncharacterized protein LOC105579248 isoform X2 n=1 Tax=Cercocebus atys TaxID=9531 RepID=UPI0005F374B5|nr:PREDICTED: uncharacterized protein LOC105579248 isoform X2 [Cercocebus atys]
MKGEMATRPRLSGMHSFSAVERDDPESERKSHSDSKSGARACWTLHSYGHVCHRRGRCERNAEGLLVTVPSRCTMDRSAQIACVFTREVSYRRILPGRGNDFSCTALKSCNTQWEDLQFHS